MNDNKDAFDLWREWAQKPRESMLMIDGNIHYPAMELSPEDRRNREQPRNWPEALRLFPPELRDAELCKRLLQMH